MANTTSFLDLLLPGFGEYRDSWWSPVNANFTAVDSWASEIQQEIVAARFSQTTLANFLTVGHEVTGILKATPEVIAARNSHVYGYQTPEPVDFTLGVRNDQVEWEVWAAREAQTDIASLNALRSPFPQSTILSGAKDGSGYPTWLGRAGANATIGGKTISLMLMIDGKLARVRTDETVLISGGSGTKYLFASYLPAGNAGKIVVNGVAISPATPNGTTSMDVGSHAIYFNDATQNFWAMKLDQTFLAGDVLTVVDSTEAGQYLVKEIIEGATLGTSTQFQIVGLFPNGGVSSINYSVSDPLRCGLGFDAAETPAAGKVYIGEVDFDGTSITAVRARHFKDTFVGEWREVNVSTTNGEPNLGTAIPGMLETKYDHCLGSDLLDISIQVSTANDGSQPIEELTIATLTNTVGVAITNGLGLVKADTLTYNQGTGDGSLSGTISYSFSGSVTGSRTGDVIMDRSAKVKWTKNSLWVKNVSPGIFYTDYSGSAKQTGFIRVIVRKRG